MTPGISWTQQSGFAGRKTKGLRQRAYQLGRRGRNSPIEMEARMGRAEQSLTLSLVLACRATHATSNSIGDTSHKCQKLA